MFGGGQEEETLLRTVLFNHWWTGPHQIMPEIFEMCRNAVVQREVNLNDGSNRQLRFVFRRRNKWASVFLVTLTHDLITYYDTEEGSRQYKFLRCDKSELLARIALPDPLKTHFSGTSAHDILQMKKLTTLS
jgi:hypothetical protein